MKLLLCIIGETYRCGGQTSRLRNGNDVNTIQNQKNAIKSHINFINYQKQKYNVECDVILNLYSLTQEKDDKIIEYYNKHL